MPTPDLVPRRFYLAHVCAPLAALALLLAPPATARVVGKDAILYVGDSLGVGTSPPLRSMVGRSPLDSDTKIGRTSTEGLSVLRSQLRRRQAVVIFDLGTNDSSAATLRKNLNRARKQTGDRLMVVFTMNKPGVASFNSAVRAFARSTDNVVLIDWHKAAGNHGLLAGDGIHATASGYRRRAALVSRWIRGRPHMRWTDATGRAGLAGWGDAEDPVVAAIWHATTVAVARKHWHRDLASAIAIANRVRPKRCRSAAPPG